MAAECATCSSDVLNGAIAGLAGITPASGYIQPHWAGLVGVVIGLSSWYSVILFKNKLKIDDALVISLVSSSYGSRSYTLRSCAA